MRAFLYTILAAILLSVSCLNIEAQERYIEVGNAKLFCNVMGEGNALIVIHGGAGYMTHDYLLPHLGRLAKNNLVVFYDQRGLGQSKSEITKEQINLKNYVEDIDAIRRALGVKKISILGHSWGGFLGMQYAIAHPESLDKLILLSSISASSEDLGVFFTEVSTRLAPYHEELEKIEASDLYQSGDPETVAANLKIVFQTYMYKPEKINQLNLCTSQNANLNGFKVVKIFQEDLFAKSYDISNDLAKFKGATLILHGDYDPIPFETAAHLQKALPQSKLLKIEQCGHFPFVEQPTVFFKAVDEFLNQPALVP